MLLHPHYHYLDLVTCFWLDFYNSPCLLSQASVFTLHKIIWNTFPKWKSVTFFPCPKSADNSLLSTEKKSKRITGFQHSFGPNPTSLILGHWDWCPFFLWSVHITCSFLNVACPFLPLYRCTGCAICQVCLLFLLGNILFYKSTT